MFESAVLTFVRPRSCQLQAHDLARFEVIYRAGRHARENVEAVPDARFEFVAHTTLYAPENIYPW